MRAVLIAMITLNTLPVSAETLTGEVLVWQDATFFLAPDAAADAITFGPRERSVGKVVQMKVVGEAGGFVELARKSYGGCLLWSSLSIDPRLDNLHVFVRRSDLAPVLVKRWAVTYSDGTRLALYPGEPISAADASGTRTIAFSNKSGAAPLAIAVKVPDDAVGLSFTPDPDARPKGYDKPGTLEVATRTVTLDGKQLTYDGPLRLFTDDLITYSGGRAMLTDDHGCEKLVVSVPKAQVRPYVRKPDNGPYGMLTGNVGDPPARYLPRGTPLSTPAGRRLASASWNVAVEPATGAQTCVDFKLSIDGSAHAPLERKLALCAPTSAVVTSSRTPTAPVPPPPPARLVALSHGKVEAGEGLDVALIRRDVQRVHGKLVRCHEDTPGAKRGTVTVTFMINVDGRANPVTASGLPGVDTCVADVVKTLAFPRPSSGPVHVEYPLEFR